MPQLSGRTNTYFVAERENGGYDVQNLIYQRNISDEEEQHGGPRELLRPKQIHLASECDDKVIKEQRCIRG